MATFADVVRLREESLRDRRTADNLRERGSSADRVQRYLERSEKKEARAREIENVLEQGSAAERILGERKERELASRAEIERKSKARQLYEETTEALKKNPDMVIPTEKSVARARFNETQRAFANNPDLVRNVRDEEAKVVEKKRIEEFEAYGRDRAKIVFEAKRAGKDVRESSFGSDVPYAPNVIFVSDKKKFGVDVPSVTYEKRMSYPPRSRDIRMSVADKKENKVISAVRSKYEDKVLELADWERRAEARAVRSREALGLGFLNVRGDESFGVQVAKGLGNRLYYASGLGTAEFVEQGVLAYGKLKVAKQGLFLYPKETFKELTGAGKKAVRVYDPRTPEGVVTWVTALTAALPAAGMRAYRSARVISTGDYVPPPRGSVLAPLLRSKKASYRTGKGWTPKKTLKQRKPKSKVQMRKESLNQFYDPRISASKGEAIFRLRGKELKSQLVKERVLRVDPLSKRFTEVKDIGVSRDPIRYKYVPKKGKVSYYNVDKTLKDMGIGMGKSKYGRGMEKAYSRSILKTRGDISKRGGTLVPREAKLYPKNYGINKGKSVSSGQQVFIAKGEKLVYAREGLKGLEVLKRQPKYKPLYEGGRRSVLKSQVDPSLSVKQKPVAEFLKREPVPVARKGFRRGQFERIVGRIKEKQARRTDFILVPKKAVKVKYEIVPKKEGKIVPKKDLSLISMDLDRRLATSDSKGLSGVNLTKSPFDAVGRAFKKKKFRLFYEEEQYVGSFRGDRFAKPGQVGVSESVKVIDLVGKGDRFGVFKSKQRLFYEAGLKVRPALSLLGVSALQSKLVTGSALLSLLRSESVQSTVSASALQYRTVTKPAFSSLLRSESVQSTVSASALRSALQSVPVADAVSVSGGSSNNFFRSERGITETPVRSVPPKPPVKKFPPIKPPPDIPRVPKRFKFFSDDKGGAFSSGVQKLQAYAAYVRRGGRDVKVSRGLVREDALDVGAKKALETLAATFKIKRVKGKAKDIKTGNEFSRFRSEFRNYRIKKGKRIPLPKDVYIERRSRRLSSGFERAEIQAAKRGKAGFF